MNDKAVCRTAPATPGLLITKQPNHLGGLGHIGDKMVSLLKMLCLHWLILAMHKKKLYGVGPFDGTPYTN